MKDCKLYLVKLRGMQTSAYGKAYVVAKDPTDAYEKVRTRLDIEDVGYSQDRELESIELLAEDTEFPDCRTRLYV